MGPRNYSCTNNFHITISDNWLRTSAVIHNVKAWARRNGYRMFISVYILWVKTITNWVRFSHESKYLSIRGFRGLCGIGVLVHSIFFYPVISFCLPPSSSLHHVVLVSYRRCFSLLMNLGLIFIQTDSEDTAQTRANAHERIQRGTGVPDPPLWKIKKM